jgi:serine/threonine-protein kinase
LSFFNELKRRNVFKVGIAYVVIAWLVTQVLQVVFESFGTPDWVMKTVLALLSVGMLFALFFAWAFELTPEGIKRESEVDRSKSITPDTGRKLNHTITFVLIAALGYFVFDKFVLDVSRDAALVEAAKQEVSQQVSEAQADAAPQQAGVSDKSIAVLPFVNMSGDEENEYFSDGLTEELLNSLARIKELKVTGRTSSFAFKGENTDLREIGRALGVAHILEGSVRKAQNRVRITAQLINVEDGYHLWSDTFDRELDDIFAIQEEIATRVVGELTSALLGDTSGPLVHLGTSNAEAYEAYLRGRYLFTRSPDDMQVLDEVDQLYEHALNLDSQFTLALFGQFMVLDFRRRSGSIDYKEGAIQLRELADKMIAMDPELAESHVALGRAAGVDKRWSESESAYNQALVLSPGNINALTYLASLLGLMNKDEERLELSQRALERDPLDLRALAGVTGAYSLLGQCADATDVATRALSLMPEAGRFHSHLAKCWLIFHGDREKAIDLYEKEPIGFLRQSGLAIVYNKLGQQEKAQQYMDDLIEANGEAASYQYAQVYAQWGVKEKAFDALERAWDIDDAGIVLLNMDKFLIPLRNEPRFIALLEKWRDPSKR